MSECVKCGCALSQDDIGCTRKMVNRGATEFMCIPCLAKRFGITEEVLREKLEYWRKSGCLLFTQTK